MSNLEQFDNTKIEAIDFETPSQGSSGSGFTLKRSHIALALFALACTTFIVLISLSKSVKISAITPVLTKPGKFVAQTADISIASWLKLPLGNRVLLMPGKHQIDISAVGFEPLTQTIEVNSGRHQHYEMVMHRLPGKLKVLLEPTPDTPVEVSIDGVLMGDFNGSVENVEAGERLVKVDAPLYRSVTQSVLVRGKGETQTLSFDLPQAWAEYQFSSKPAGATVYVDDQAIGQTPLSARLEEGLRKLRLKADGFKPYLSEVAVVAQQDLLIPEIALTPADGTLDVKSTPENAAVIFNGEFRGLTPMTLEVEPNTDHAVQVYKAGFRLHQNSFNLTPEQKLTEVVVLSKDLVPVQISVSPSDAEILVDGVSRGKGSKKISLDTLPHKISVRSPGFVPFSTELVPTKGNAQIVSVQLLTQDQHYWAQVPDAYTTKYGHKMKLFKNLGKVKMGSGRREAGRRANEVQYTAELSKPFYVSLHETTNKQFRAYKASHNSGNYKKKSLDANNAPAVNISWQQAAQYCNWLSQKEGLDPFYQTRKGFVSGLNPNANGYRLLTEAEWSWLAREKQGESLLYPWGNTPRPTSARPIENFADEKAEEIIAFTLSDYDDGYKGSAPVGRFDPNHKGLFDIGGNASEWVNDWYSAKGSRGQASKRAIKDPLGPDIGEFHVVRGASWAKGHLPQLRLAYRDYSAKGKHDIGFRVARYAGRTLGNVAAN